MGGHWPWFCTFVSTPDCCCKLTLLCVSSTGEDLAAVAARAGKSKLTAWFEFNKAAADEYTAAQAEHAAELQRISLAPSSSTSPPEEPPPAPIRPAALSTTYQDICKIATWNDNKKAWKKRSNNMTLPVGRMYHVPPSGGERFWLRTLLHTVPGATCYEDLRTYGGGADAVLHPTFKAACHARGLTQDDGEWRACMEDAVVSAPPAQLRNLFATILLFNEVTDPLAL